MQVVIVCRGVPSARTPLWGIFELDQARALQAAGHRVSIAALDVRSLRHRRRFGIWRENLDGIEVVHISVPLGRVPARLDDAVLRRMCSRALRMIAAASPIDVVHAHFTKYGLAAARSRAAEDRWPLVLTEHSSQLRNPDAHPGLARRAEQVYAQADAIVAVSHSLAKALHARFDVAPVVISNVVSADDFAGPGRQSHSSTRLVSVGSLRAIKRMDLLIAAFARAFAPDDEVSLDIVGDGPERGALEQRIEQLGLQQRVRLLGGLPRAELASLYPACDGFVLASRSETFGVAIVEAMAAGLPVLSSRSGGPDEVITPADGVLVDVEDVDDLVEPLRDFVARLDHYDGQQISWRTQERFGPQAIASQLDELYRSLQH